ncbi:MAG: VOC family protein [Pseudomonadota bacterium]
MIHHIGFQSLPVTDQDRALAFYRDVLGFRVQTDAPYEDDWRWIFLTLPGAQTRLHFARADEITVKDKPALCLVCDDVDADVPGWRDKGAEIVNAPQNAPWQPGTRWATLRDPEGNLIFVESKVA